MKEAKEFVDFVSEFLKELIAASSFNNVQILQNQAKHLFFIVSMVQQTEDFSTILEAHRWLKIDIEDGVVSWKDEAYFDEWQHKFRKTVIKEETELENEVTEDESKDDCFEEIKIEEDRKVENKIIKISLTTKEKSKKRKLDSGDEDEEYEEYDTRSEKLKSRKERKNKRKGFVKLSRCEHCEFKTRNERVYERHNFEEHERTMCKCGMYFTEFEEYYKHMKNEHQDIKCPKCPKTFAFNRLLEYHMDKAHSGPLKCLLCPYCAKYLGKNSLQAHIERAHDKEKHEKCPHCDHRAYKQDLKKHIERLHQKADVARCEYCGGVTKNLKRHLLNNQCDLPPEERHKKVKVPCTLCDKYLIKGQLARHIKTVHENVKDHTCHLCEFRSSNVNNLRVHIKRIHEKRPLKETCPYCNMEVQILEYHIKTYHGEKLLSNIN